jgi:molybdopterin-containing oxidoreductase family iron-sulfur binding subunit
MNDPESDPNKHLEKYKEDNPNDTSEFENRKSHTVSTFRLLEEKGTDPNVVYVGNEPSPHAEQVEGPVTYEERGLVDDRKESVLDEGAAANDDAEGEA